MKQILCGIIACLLLSSCSAYRLSTKSVAYQSVRTTHAQPAGLKAIPEEAKIAVSYSISKDGALTAVVYNRTTDILIIDQTTSFFVNSDGKSVSYYDPTIKTTSVTDISSSTSAASVNLGAVAGALGVGGTVGQLANGINVGGSTTDGSSTTSVTYIADQPRISIGPKGSGKMSKEFKVTGVGTKALSSVEKSALNNVSSEESKCCFSVCISYSFDNGATFDKLVTEFYTNSKVIIPVSDSHNVNNALREVYQIKPDALDEYWWLLYFNTNHNIKNTSYLENGSLFDYK